MKINSIFTRPTSTGNHISTIYIEHDNFFFPSSGWTDFSVIIMSWWIAELLNQLKGQKKGRYLFMDGPYYFLGTFSDTNIVTLSFVHDKNEEPELVKTFDLKIEDFTGLLKNCAESILMKCKEFQYYNSDVEELQRIVEKLNSEWN